MSAVWAHGHVMCGVNVASEEYIEKVGEVAFQTLAGKFPAPSSVSKKGRQRIALGGYKVDGKHVSGYEVLRDDLCVLGWIVESVASFLHELDKINGEPVKLDVLVDRLPNHQGGEAYHKATLLKDLMKKASGGRAILQGVPDPEIEVQRDIFVDNLAGLARELHTNPSSHISRAYQQIKDKPIRFNRTNI